MIKSRHLISRSLNWRQEEELSTLFSQAGTVESVDLIKDRSTGRSKGFGFIVMGNQSELEKAIQMFNNYNLGNRNLTVNIARLREERSQGGSGESWQIGNKRSDRSGSRRY
jgi:RNA recognition motif-containing protein